MEKNRNQFLIVLALLFLVMLPNLVFVWLGKDSAVTSNLKQVVFLFYSLSLVLLPLSFIRPKYIFILLIPFLPFALLDLYVLSITGTQSTTMHYYSLVATNFNEATELIRGNILALIFSLVYVTVYFILFFKLKLTTVIQRKTSLFFKIFSISIITLLLVRDVKMAYDLSKNSMLSATKYHFFIKLDKTFPFGSLSKLYDVFEDINRIGLFNTKNKDFSYESTVFNNEGRTIVLVIGETARRNNFEIYGYNRDNNPFLTKDSNLIAYTHFTTNSNFTLSSVAQILSSVGPNSYDKAFDELGIPFAFKEAGYKTYWITNQNYSYGSAFNMFAKSVDTLVDVSTTLDMPNNDLVILPYFKDFVASSNKKKFIVIHTIGSHYRYNLRYPKEFSKYKPELDNSISVAENGVKYRDKYVNSYDNSILLTDYFLSELKRELGDSNQEYLMVYLSDHGENLYDNNEEMFLHGSSQPSEFELEIPMFIWYSDGCNPSLVDKLISNKEKKLSSEVIFHTLSTMGGFRTKLHNVEHDLLSDSLMQGNRSFLKSDGSVMSIDK